MGLKKLAIFAPDLVIGGAGRDAADLDRYYPECYAAYERIFVVYRGRAGILMVEQQYGYPRR